MSQVSDMLAECAEAPEANQPGNGNDGSNHGVDTARRSGIQRRTERLTRPRAGEKAGKEETQRTYPASHCGNGFVEIAQANKNLRDSSTHETGQRAVMPAWVHREGEQSERVPAKESVCICTAMPKLRAFSAKISTAVAQRTGDTAF
jgi:hypothetical protein